MKQITITATDGERFRVETTGNISTSEAFGMLELAKVHFTAQLMDHWNELEKKPSAKKAKPKSK